MIQAIESFFTNSVGKELAVFFCSMIPVIECRGAIPLGCGLGLAWYWTFLLSFAGNLLPVPFILLLIEKIILWMEKSKVKAFQKFASFLRRKVEKHKGKIEKYSYWGLVLFVAIPLPGTGAWTGSLIAALLGLDVKKSTLAATLGVTISCTIMTIGSYLIKSAVT
ncbi:MAG: small multi-drug export protein [Clostridia bacterium]|nr:small multi-drug export protein [Clostridia bacterium]